MSSCDLGGVNVFSDGTYVYMYNNALSDIVVLCRWDLWQLTSNIFIGTSWFVGGSGCIVGIVWSVVVACVLSHCRFELARSSSANVCLHGQCFVFLSLTACRSSHSTNEPVCGYWYRQKFDFTFIRKPSFHGPFSLVWMVRRYVVLVGQQYQSFSETTEILSLLFYCMQFQLQSLKL